MTDFADLLTRLAQAAERGDGAAMAACFTPDGAYHDVFYGLFVGRDQIARMITDYFHRDGEDFTWRFFDPVSDGHTGYAWYEFSYASKLKGFEGRRALLKSASKFRLRDGLIASYEEFGNSGVALAMIGMDDAAIRRHLQRAAKEIQAAAARPT